MEVKVSIFEPRRVQRLADARATITFDNGATVDISDIAILAGKFEVRVDLPKYAVPDPQSPSKYKYLPSVALDRETRATVERAVLQSYHAKEEARHERIAV